MPSIFTRELKDVVKQRPDSKQSRRFAGISRIAARTILAATLLLTLVAATIVWPAAASGPLCAMACCAGKAPHAAGSCMHGACETGVSVDQEASGSYQHTHDHHEQQALQSESTSPILAGVTAGACGADMEQMPTIVPTVPTIDATGDQVAADQSVSTKTSKTENVFAVSADAVSPPCQPGCGACASSIAASKRSRKTAPLAGFQNPLPSLSAKPAGSNHSLTYSLSSFGRCCAPRGPPASFS